MIEFRRSDDRGRSRYDWLDSRHSFSFADYYDPTHMGFSHLRVLNEDRVAPGRGFGPHTHRDMEILTYVLDGALEHRDSLGHGSVLQRGCLQRMTAGTGVTHSETNPSASDPVHFLQIWILPEQQGLAPGYEELAAPSEPPHGLRLAASRDGRDDSLRVHQDVELWLGRVEPQRSVRYAPAPGRRLYLHLTRGTLAVNGKGLQPGDGAALVGEPAAELEAGEPAELLLFDLP